MLKEIKRASFVKSDLQYSPPAIRHENFIVSINDVEKRIYLRLHNVDPETGRSTGARSIEQEVNLIESFNPGDLVDLIVSEYHWSVGDRRGTKYYLVSISRSR